tara:strand:+ start:39 stop:1172 length:1134 start_codon:yes stop_codon:yes gene_type:complete
MKIFKNIIIGSAVIFALIYTFNLEYFIKGIGIVYLRGYTTVYIDDLEYFDFETIKANDIKSPWIESEIKVTDFSEDFENYNKEMGTVAYLVIQNDTIIGEKYYKNYSANSSTNSFSMSKSFVTLTMGKAIEQGYINSLNDKVIDYIPELKGKFASDVEIVDLAAMTSGIIWEEGTSNPFSPVAKQYFYEDQKKLMFNQPFDNKSGENYLYSSGNTQLLSILIERATNTDFKDYFENELWHKIYPDYDAYWQIDSKKSANIKSFCCFHSNARDFSRFGKLVLNNGSWDGEQIISPSFIELSLEPYLENFDAYGIGMWLSNYKGFDFSLMSGHQGQYVIIIPDKDLIITRLGKKDVNLGEPGISPDVLKYIDEALSLIN